MKWGTQQCKGERGDARGEKGEREERRKVKGCLTPASLETQRPRRETLQLLRCFGLDEGNGLWDK